MTTCSLNIPDISLTEAKHVKLEVNELMRIKVESDFQKVCPTRQKQLMCGMWTHWLPMWMEHCWQSHCSVDLEINQQWRTKGKINVTAHWPDSWCYRWLIKDLTLMISLWPEKGHVWVCWKQQDNNVGCHLLHSEASSSKLCCLAIQFSNTYLSWRPLPFLGLFVI